MSLVTNITTFEMPTNYSNLLGSNQSSEIFQSGQLIYNGKEYQVLPKQLPEVIGEYVLRPTIEFVKRFFWQSTNYFRVLDSQISFFPSVQAKTKPDHSDEKASGHWEVHGEKSSGQKGSIGGSGSINKNGVGAHGSIQTNPGAGPSYQGGINYEQNGWNFGVQVGKGPNGKQGSISLGKRF